MAGFIIKTINGVKQRVAITSDTGSGNPLGTIIAVYSNHVPDGYLPCNGTTFDQTQYPALYTLLGTNVLPDLRNKALMGANPSSQTTPASGNTSDVGDTQTAQLPNSKQATATGGYGSPSGTGPFYATSYPWNLQSGGALGSSYVAFDLSRAGASTDHLGNNVFTDNGETRPANARVNFCIKATAGITENQADYVGDIIKDYVNDGEAYSTAEVKTNKTWIDGKPIYRKVIDFGALPNVTTKSVPHGISNIDRYVSFIGYSTDGTGTIMLPRVSYGALSEQIMLWANKTEVVVSTNGTWGTFSSTYITVEYTKTTD